MTDVEHRAAGDVALFVRRAVLDGEQAFRVLRCHAEECRDPHPKERAGTADLDCRRDADDIARSDRRGERDAERLEARNVAFALVLRLEDEAKRLRQVADLQELEADRQEDACADEQGDERRAPHDRVNRV